MKENNNYCTNCGTKLYDGDLYCGNCGKRVVGEVIDSDGNTATTLSIISISTVVINIINLFTMFYTKSNSIDLISVFLLIIGLIFMIIVRVKYPKNRLGKMAMFSYIILVWVVMFINMIAIGTCFDKTSSYINDGGCQKTCRALE